MNVSHTVGEVYDWIRGREQQEEGLEDAIEIVVQLEEQLDEIKGLVVGMQSPWFAKFLGVLDAQVRQKAAQLALAGAADPEKHRADLLRAHAMVEWHDTIIGSIHAIQLREEKTVDGLNTANQALNELRQRSTLHQQGTP